MRSGETSGGADFPSGELLSAIFRDGLTNGPPQPTGMVTPGVFTGASFIPLLLWRLSGRAAGQGSVGAGSPLLSLPGMPGAAARPGPPVAALSEFTAVSGAVPKVTEITSEVLPVVLVRNNCT